MFFTRLGHRSRGISLSFTVQRRLRHLLHAKHWPSSLMLLFREGFIALVGGEDHTCQIHLEHYTLLQYAIRLAAGEDLLGD